MQVRALLHLNAPVGRAVIEEITKAKGVPFDEIASFADKPLRSFYSEAVCGGILLKYGESDGQGAAATVPMAFQSAMAGIMLGAEMVIQCGQLREENDDVTTRIDLLRPILAPLSFPEKPRSNCICRDDDYVARAREKTS